MALNPAICCKSKRTNKRLKKALAKGLNFSIMRLTETGKQPTKRLTQSELPSGTEKKKRGLKLSFRNFKLNVDFEFGKRIIRTPTQRTTGFDALLSS